ncbi:MAG: hypothetical protein WC789_04950 [Lentisphaeria bacterium]|jgi:hypothetical protein
MAEQDTSSGERDGAPPPPKINIRHSLASGRRLGSPIIPPFLKKEHQAPAAVPPVAGAERGSAPAPPPLPAAPETEEARREPPPAGTSLRRRTERRAMPPMAKGMVLHQAPARKTAVALDRVWLLATCALTLAAAAGGLLPLACRFLFTRHLQLDLLRLELAVFFLTTLFVALNKGWSKVLAGLLLLGTMLAYGGLALLLAAGEAVFAELLPSLLPAMPTAGGAAGATMLALAAVILLTGHTGNFRRSCLVLCVAGGAILPWLTLESRLPAEIGEPVAMAAREAQAALAAARLATATATPESASQEPAAGSLWQATGQPPPPRRAAAPTTSGRDFGVALPPDWRIMESRFNGGFETLFQPTDASVTLRLQRELATEPQSLDQLLDRELYEIRKEFVNSLVKNLPGLPDRKRIFAADGDRRLLRLVVLAKDDRRQYILSCRAERSTLQRNLPQLDAIFASFRPVP